MKTKSRAAHCWRMILTVGCCMVLEATASPAQDEVPSPDAVIFKTLVAFNGTNGAFPVALAQGIDGNVYGITYGTGTGGANGNFFRMTASGSLTVLYNFCVQPNCADGSSPNWLVLGADGSFYGAALGGGAYSNGTVFKITPDGTLTTIYSFCALPNCGDGSTPFGLIQATDGNLYGTTVSGGAGNSGTVFKVTPEGALTTLYCFCSLANCTDGSFPAATVIQGIDGNFYGTTELGGAYNEGTAFKVTPSGKLTTLHSFCAEANCVDGGVPLSALVQAASGDFYGTAQGEWGVVFKVTAAGAFQVAYGFCTGNTPPNCTDGWDPLGGLTLATDGNFYGTTVSGGTYDNCYQGCGTIFRVTPGGTLTTLHNFNGTDGNFVYGTLLQATSGTFYGPDSAGGPSNPDCGGGCGTIFGLDVGLRPFIETLPTSGKVGEGIRFLGNDLTGATSVSFNGTAAQFNIVSPTEIETRVPDGATTGFVTVTTPAATLKSNVQFRVRQ
jgi:uncharacterized repeat protein (TIGR03803 family)